MKRLWFLIAVVAWVEPAMAAEVGDCPDGHTCQVVSEAYTGPVRLFCVEAPPMSEPIGKQARAELRKEVHGTIRVLMDSQENGMPIAEFIRDDGWNLGLELIRAGLARVDRRYCEEVGYIQAENEAKAARLGRWATSAKFNCKGPRYCKEVKTCDEAMFYLKQCGRRDFDRDEDGVPCEGICGVQK